MSLVTINWKPDTRQLRQFGFICTLVFGAWGGWVYVRHAILGISLAELTTVSWSSSLWILATLCAGLSVIAPSVLRPLFVGMSLIGMPVGYVVSFLVLAIVYFGVLTPLGLVFRLIGRDALQRRFDLAARSYWTPREPVADIKRYYRQF